MSGGWEYLNTPDSFSDRQDYLTEALENVALFTVLDMRATMFSRAKVIVTDLDGKPIDNDPFIKLIEQPNFSQSQQDFLYQHLFFKGLGNNVTRVIASKPYDIDKAISLEHLVPSQIDYNNVNKVDKFVYAKSDINDVNKRALKYELDGKSYDIPLDEVLFFYDIANGLTKDSRFRSPSRIDSLRPALANIREAQKAKNINLKISSKHIISSGLTGDGMKDGLQPGEKSDIENNLFRRDTFATESNLNVNSLANDFRKLAFDDGIIAEMLKISNAYGINKDVLNWSLNGASTHDNKHFGAVDWIQNSIQFEGDDFANSWASHFNYRSQNKLIKLDYSHLPVMQILKEKEVESIKTRMEIAKGLLDLGFDVNQAVEAMGLNELSNGK